MSGDSAHLDKLKRVIGLLPHRYPFLLIDKVVELEPGIKVKTLKNVSHNENYFVGHFPDNPVMPGVLQIEFMAQAAAICVLSLSDGSSKKEIFLTGIDQAKFRRMVVPGDVIRAEIKVTKRKGIIWVFDCIVYLESEQNEVIASAVIKATGG